MQRRNEFLGIGFFLVCFLFGTMGCGPSETEKQVQPANIDELVEHQQLLEAGLGMLSDWMSHWRSEGLEGGVASFTKTQTSPIENLERPEVNPLANSESPLEPFQLANPEELGVVDIYDYKVRIDEQGAMLYEPDAEVIFYKDNGMRERLLFIGPSGLFEDAVWVTGRTLFVGGYFEGEGGFSPMLWLVSLDSGTYEVYESSFVSPNYARHGYLEEKLTNGRK
ncbi:MAG: bifunctional isocitrate dehydrogenase kinase/phosphatase [Lunatimonas sp.]|uniref:bifunctional isocitrate dehydrogenase kinase/phosphatase n=1 Tax=Lunatimonas sp. TaxID=2060141 RepID=UPI00263AFCE8|nr:bifunctional isocitrate dehydrogenase kinase/phosphatase [Lunatimonas sp.]MCC5937504.1 bifunctional isocitrate dehydrogenase kinase/phosphatase [Lunatimonas sp.]